MDEDDERLTLHAMVEANRQFLLMLARLLVRDGVVAPEELQAQLLHAAEGVEKMSRLYSPSVIEFAAQDLRGLAGEFRREPPPPRPSNDDTRRPPRPRARSPRRTR
jgi:hypothetical protein